MNASDVPAATPSSAARAVPPVRRPMARVTARMVTTATVQSSQLDGSAVAAPASPGDATPRKMASPSTTRRMAVHWARVMGLPVHAAMIRRVNSSDVVSSGCTTTSEPRWRAAVCNANPATLRTRPVTHSGRRTRRTSRLGRPAWAVGISAAARASNATPAPKARADTSASITITVARPPRTSAQDTPGPTVSCPCAANPRVVQPHRLPNASPRAPAPSRVGLVGRHLAQQVERLGGRAPPA